MIFMIPGCQVGVTWCFFRIQGDLVTILGKKCRFICKIKKKVLSLRGFSGTACRSAGGCAACSGCSPGRLCSRESKVESRKSKATEWQVTVIRCFSGRPGYQGTELLVESRKQKVESDRVTIIPGDRDTR